MILKFQAQHRALQIVYVYLYIYMLTIASQTAGPFWLKFFEETHVYSGDNIWAKKLIYF